MRTNTWLGLVWLNQMTQVLQADNIAREQKARDEARDAMFAKAHEAAQQGQFAMWIQTPDGQRFERWSRHALEASRAIDDRQSAWALAWEIDFQERRESARLQIIADAEASVPVVSAEDMHRARRQGIVASIVTATLCVVWVALVMVAPTTAEGDVVVSPASVVAFVFMGLAGIFAAWRFWISFADKRRRDIVNAKVEKSIGNIEAPSRISWHRRANAERLREAQAMIVEVVTSAPAKFPRNDDLVELAGTYDTQPYRSGEQNAPESIQRLLEAFRSEDRDRVAALERDRIA